MKWKLLKHSYTPLEENIFWKILNILIIRSHLVNKRLIGAENVIHLNCSTNKHDILNLLASTQFSTIEEFENLIINSSINDNSKTLDFYIRNLIPKSKIYKIHIEIVVIDKFEREVYFIPPSGSNITPKFAYFFRYTENRCLELYIDIEENINRDTIKEDDPSVIWLQTTVFSKLEKWAHPSQNMGTPSNPSLNLLSITKYGTKYSDLKSKYGTYLVEQWPEKTDPSKYVFEDLAIAAYLIILFEKQRELGLNRNQSFVDLGCGNGLLTFLLNSEGYPGMGIDIRKRGIWDFFGNKANLKEMSITPSDSTLFPEYDWIIGNHSDELTPWIPVIAARSSYHTNAFILPCCAHDFVGKYTRFQTQLSQYQAYLIYLEELCTKMGFKVFRDRLRIPSTKRTCLIGMGRNYSKECEAEIDGERTSYIKERSQYSAESTDTKWAPNFKPRSKIEKVKNCTKLEPELISFIVSTLFHKLLEAGDSGCAWNAGGMLKMGEVASLFDQSTLLKLKNQCGGLQTLLKNKSSIFRMHQGNVLLRNPADSKSSSKAPSQPCWFYLHHPQGCPALNCSYLHPSSTNLTT